MSSNIDQLSGDFLKNTINGYDNPLEKTWNDYKEMGWATSTASGLASATFETFSLRDNFRKENQAAMRETFNEQGNLNGFENPFTPDTWWEQMINNNQKFELKFELRSKKLFKYTLPKWYAPEFFRHYRFRWEHLD